MIREAAQKVIEAVDRLTSRKQLETQAKAIKETSNAITEINTSAKEWLRLFQAVSPYLSPADATRLRSDGIELSKEIEKLLERFSNGEHAQVPILQKFKPKVEKLRRATQDAWEAYANGKFAPYERLAKIAQRLPSMQEQKSDLAFLVTQIRKIPSNNVGVEEFHRSLESLSAILSRLEGLPPDVQKFLDSLLTDSATIDLITDEVLAWCRRERLTPRLRIKFE